MHSWILTFLDNNSMWDSKELLSIETREPSLYYYTIDMWNQWHMYICAISEFINRSWYQELSLPKAEHKVKFRMVISYKLKKDRKF